MWNRANTLFFRSVCIPALVIAAVNAYNLWNEHWEHWEHLPPLEERVEYPYQNIRTKNFPWGDGDKVCGPLGSACRCIGNCDTNEMTLQTLLYVSPNIPCFRSSRKPSWLVGGKPSTCTSWWL